MSELLISPDPFLSMAVRSALFLAGEEARHSGSPYAGTGHVLCGLTRERESVAGKALSSLGLSIEGVRGILTDILRPANKTGGSQVEPLGFSPRAEKLIELALRAAVDDGRATIETHDVLGSLRSLGEGTAVEVLERAGVGAAELSKALDEQLGDGDESGGTIPLPLRAVDSLDPEQVRGMPAGEILVRTGLISSEQLTNALDQARRSDELIGRTLVNLGLINEDDLVRALALQVGLEFVDLSRTKIDPDVARLLPAAVAWRYLAIPIGERDKRVVVAIADSANEQVLDDIAVVLDRELHPVVATPSDIIHAIREHLGSADAPPQVAG